MLVQKQRAISNISIRWRQPQSSWVPWPSSEQLPSSFWQQFSSSVLPLWPSWLQSPSFSAPGGAFPDMMFVAIVAVHSCKLD
jgi:hypothetical protein